MGVSRLITAVFIFISISISSSWARSLIVVSDLDDTLKITKVQSAGRAVWNGLFTRKVFAGVPHLWANLQHYVDKSYVLTSSPNQIRFNILKLFRKFDLQVDELITRSLIFQRDSFRYKYLAIKNIILDNPYAELILLGDNTDKDHEVYQLIKNEYPQNVNTIYMHKVKNIEIPNGQVPWFSTFDIAAHEFIKKRMPYSEVMGIYEALMNVHSSKIIPTKLFCPKKIDDWNNLYNSDLQRMRHNLVEKILKHCRLLSKG